MSLTADQITAQNFKDFYGQIRPYLNGNFPTPIVNCFAKSDMHSTDEKIIGTASDGKPLYQKCFDIAAFNHPLSTGNSSRITLMESTGKKLINAFGYLWKSTGTTSVQIPSCAITSGASPYIYYQTTVDEVNDNFRLVYERNDTNQMSFDGGGYVVLQYTKSTDSAIKVGTGTDYSTDEQIIGTWLDGKPLYQKTVYCEAMPNATSKTVAHGISNASFKKIYGYMYGSQYDIAATLPYISKAANDIQIIKVTCDTTNINIVSTHDFSGFVGYVTVCYTKNTD